ncbi:uncharacterized protein [Rutidosis leptorrhynchoides]|uniref:uncharacterized protein n=1 Tax=Rutidosis leptorrhynchoides TaxID=125765 RepID=UPI003A99D280
MYNGIGLQTARGSGTNGYTQSNKFFVKPRENHVLTGNNDVTRNPNRDIVEHERKRQIQLKLVVLEDKLVDQGYSDDEISEKLDKARKNLEADMNLVMHSDQKEITLSFGVKSSNLKKTELANKKSRILVVIKPEFDDANRIQSECNKNEVGLKFILMFKGPYDRL